MILTLLAHSIFNYLTLLAYAFKSSWPWLQIIDLHKYSYMFHTATLLLGLVHN